jgi:hypothetical protein
MDHQDPIVGAADINQYRGDYLSRTNFIRIHSSPATQNGLPKGGRLLLVIQILVAVEREQIKTSWELREKPSRFRQDAVRKLRQEVAARAFLAIPNLF